MAQIVDCPVAAAYTSDFIRRSLPADARRLLEIGCGAGELARLLTGDGFYVTALDSSEEAVAAARRRGVDAQLRDWPALIDGKFDAVLFTRSLHHIADLSGAIAAARAALPPNGLVIVEDFRAEGGSERSSDWYRAMVSELYAAGALSEAADLDALLAKVDADHHDHQLHSSAIIEMALRQTFEVTANDCAYYFRYLEPVLREAGAAQWLLNIELEQMDAGAIDPLGRRFVCRAVS